MFMAIIRPGFAGFQRALGNFRNLCVARRQAILDQIVQL